MTETICILAGYGNTGCPLADLLLRFSEARLVLAGRDLKRAEAAAAALPGAPDAASPRP
ncbi:MAG: hypothetical protein JXN59_02935 [Anaerolineae bacterium]|nr:hypothetical protein [Anaerolineae bacterium]